MKPTPDKRIKRERQLSEDWQAVARTPEGRRVIADLFAWGWVFQPIEENDPMGMARANGERNFALRVSRYLNLTPEVFAEAMRSNDEAIGEMIGDNEYRALMAHYLSPKPSGPLNS
jgi:hypothetical protein